jgi:hypothetical protein
MRLAEPTSEVFRHHVQLAATSVLDGNLRMDSSQVRGEVWIDPNNGRRGIDTGNDRRPCIVHDVQANQPQSDARLLGRDEPYRFELSRAAVRVTPGGATISDRLRVVRHPEPPRRRPAVAAGDTRMGRRAWLTEHSPPAVRSVPTPFGERRWAWLLEQPNPKVACGSVHAATLRLAGSGRECHSLGSFHRNERQAVRPTVIAMDEREEVWGRLHEALPARWTVGLGSFNPGEHRWSVSAVGPHPGRGKLPIYVTGFGQDELEAVRDLDARLRGERAEGPRKLDELRARLRLAYVEGAEEWAQERTGRSLSNEELVHIIQNFPSVDQS